MVLLRLRVLLGLGVLGLLFEGMGCFSGLYWVREVEDVKEGVLWRRSRTIGAQRDGGMLRLEGWLGLDDMEVDSYLNNINNNDFFNVVGIIIVMYCICCSSFRIILNNILIVLIK